MIIKLFGIKILKTTNTKSVKPNKDLLPIDKPNQAIGIYTQYRLGYTKSCQLRFRGDLVTEKSVCVLTKNG